jgi:hypothetical protein
VRDAAARQASVRELAPNQLPKRIALHEPNRTPPRATIVLDLGPGERTAHDPAPLAQRRRYESSRVRRIPLPPREVFASGALKRRPTLIDDPAVAPAAGGPGDRVIGPVPHLGAALQRRREEHQ